MVKNRIEESIEDGSYFKEAIHWYNEVFLYPLRSNAFMMGAGVSISVVFLFILYSLWGVFPLSEQVRVVVKTSDTLSRQVRLESVGSAAEDTKEAVVDYLVTKYINAREIYDPTTYESDYYFILSSTEKNIFNDYYDKISKKSAWNPAVLYKKGFRGDIRVMSTHYDSKNNVVDVKFNKQNYNIYSGERSSENFSARVQFYLSDYNFEKSKDANLNFIVTDYEVEKVQS